MARGNKNQVKNETSTTKDKYISVRKKPWHDLQDDRYVYKQGDTFPREGLEVSEERIKELSTINNKLGEVLIQKVEIEEDSKEVETVVEDEATEETENIETNNAEESTDNTEDDSTEEDTQETENIEE